MNTGCPIHHPDLPGQDEMFCKLVIVCQTDKKNMSEALPLLVVHEQKAEHLNSIKIANWFHCEVHFYISARSSFLFRRIAVHGLMFFNKAKFQESEKRSFCSVKIRTWEL